MANPSSHRFLLFTLRLCLAAELSLAPYSVAVHPTDGLKIVLTSALAKSGNGGNSGGNGNGGNGNGNGNGGNSGNNGNGQGGTDNPQDGRSNTKPADKAAIPGDTVQVTYPDGISERVKAGRFQMKDAQGRTIIDRPAKASDIKRLRGL